MWRCITHGRDLDDPPPLPQRSARAAAAHSKKTAIMYGGRHDNCGERCPRHGGCGIFRLFRGVSSSPDCATVPTKRRHPASRLGRKRGSMKDASPFSSLEECPGLQCPVILRQQRLQVGRRPFPIRQDSGGTQRPLSFSDDLQPVWNGTASRRRVSSGSDFETIATVGRALRQCAAVREHFHTGP